MYKYSDNAEKAKKNNWSKWEKKFPYRGWNYLSYNYNLISNFICYLDGKDKTSFIEIMIMFRLKTFHKSRCHVEGRKIRQRKRTDQNYDLQDIGMNIARNCYNFLRTIACHLVRKEADKNVFMKTLWKNRVQRIQEMIQRCL